VVVGDQVVTDTDHPVHDADAITIDGQPLAPEPPLVMLYHKPLGVHSSVTDGHGRLCLGTVASALVDAGLHPVGRLDVDTDGLLLFSSDGALTQWLLHPRRAVERVYVAQVDPPPTTALGPVLANGVETAEGRFTAELRGIDGDRLTLAVTEGKYRMVRRMLANAGHPVVSLRRVSYGPFALGDLPAGEWRQPSELESAALASLRRLVPAP
jgi:23S rRNA pseudouridine2605 synthase